MREKNIRVLVTNDDGIYAEGIRMLAESLSRAAEVTVVAPDVERSAVGHAITLNDPLRVEEVKRDGRFFGYAVNGTPADSVKIAISAIMKHRPDMVFSGINPGLNIGTDIIYSGTVSAAIEGIIMGCCSVAISIDMKKDAGYKSASDFALRLLHLLEARNFPKILLNVNIPSAKDRKIKGVRVTRQGRMQFKDHFDKRQDPSGRTYYWLTGEHVDTEEKPDVDSVALREGYISVTPIHYNLTDEKALKELEEWSF